ncbi:hypothetical protein LIA77_01530 [Sarocladium implicatum]|nr:hypothetical protein LIA77_01530 [Sarocladium implicatum]
MAGSLASRAKLGCMGSLSILGIGAVGKARHWSPTGSSHYPPVGGMKRCMRTVLGIMRWHRRRVQLVMETGDLKLVGDEMISARNLEKFDDTRPAHRTTGDTL